jgi:hypothetical protein
MLFYVYALARPVKVKRSIDWRVFYIGKGSKRRVWRHESEARRGCRCHKCNIIRKVWREGGEIQRYILLTTEDEQTAFAYEKEMIAMHGRENLVNYTEGGDGASGTIVSDETRALLAARTKQTWGDPVIRERRMAAHRIAMQQPELKALKSRQARGRKATAAARANGSAAAKRRYENPEERAKSRENMQRQLTVPEMRDRIIGGIRRSATGTEGRAARSKIRTQAWANPESRAKTIEGLRAAWQDPEQRQKRSEAMRQGWARRKALRDKQSDNHS